MNIIDLTYERWIEIHRDYRSIINRVPHVACMADGKLVLVRVRFVRAIERPRVAPAASTGQLKLRSA
jgi:hypothetical protein